MGILLRDSTISKGLNALGHPMGNKQVHDPQSLDRAATCAWFQEEEATRKSPRGPDWDALITELEGFSACSLRRSTKR